MDQTQLEPEDLRWVAFYALISTCFKVRFPLSDSLKPSTLPDDLDPSLAAVPAIEEVATRYADLENLQGVPSWSDVRPSPVREWRDVTGEFFDCVKELQLGELIHDNMFGLFDAMSAIEMMDPKMDAGMCCNKEATPLTFQTAVETSKMKLANLECRETIGIIDAVYSCTVSWLEGHSMAQTVLTCLYLHHPNQIEDKPMRAFACAIHKLVNLIRNFILRARVYEEEDFQPSTYGYDLCCDLTETKACNMLKSAEEDLVRKLKDTEGEREKEEVGALLSRLKFTRLLLQCLVSLYPTKVTTRKSCFDLFLFCIRFVLNCSKVLPGIPPRSLPTR